MWYEILPSLFLTTFFAAFPMTAVPLFFNWLDTGRFVRRRLEEPYQQRYLQRDQWLTGHFYNCNSLEVIPDEGESLESLKWQGEDPVGNLRLYKNYYDLKRHCPSWVA